MSLILESSNYTGVVNDPLDLLGIEREEGTIEMVLSDITLSVFFILLLYF